MHEVEQVIKPAARISRRPTVKLGLHPRYPRPRPLRDPAGCAAVRRASCGIAASFPPRNRCRPSPCDRLSRSRTTTAAPPHPARSAAGAPIPGSRAGCPPPGTSPGSSRVHCDSLGGGGARLCPSGPAMPTPQAFSMTSQVGSHASPGFPPFMEDSRTRRARPVSARFEPVSRFKDEITPVPRVLLSATLAGPAPSGSTRHVPALSGLLPPSPAPPGSGCPQLHQPAAAGQRRRSFTSTRIISASRRTPYAGEALLAGGVKHKDVVTLRYACLSTTALCSR